MIATSSGRDAQTAVGWVVAPVPSMVIGAEDSPSDYLHGVQGVKGLPGGRVLVADGGSAEFRFYDAVGNRERAEGGRGAGPGEFQNPVLVPWIGTDSILVFDKGLPRVQVVSPGGEHFTSEPYPQGWPAGRVPPVGALNSILLFERRVPVGGWTALAGSGIKQVKSDYFWYDRDTGSIVDVTSIVWDLAYRTRWGDHLVDIPFNATPGSAVGEEGAFLTDGRNWEIRAFDAQGSLYRIIRVEGEERPVTERMQEAKLLEHMGEATGDLRKRRRRDFEEVPKPENLPVFHSLLVDELGWLWAEIYVEDRSGPTEWMVFDPKGQAKGIVEIPPGLEVLWIGEDRILGLWLDDLDVEYIHQHRLLGRTGASRRVPLQD